MKLRGANWPCVLLACVFAATSAAAAKPNETKMSKLYNEILAQLSAGNGDGRAKFMQAQENWRKFRDAECAFAASHVEGGSVYPQIVDACRTKLTQQRIKALEYYDHCKEGDLSCPVPPK